MFPATSPRARFAAKEWIFSKFIQGLRTSGVLLPESGINPAQATLAHCTHGSMAINFLLEQPTSSRVSLTSEGTQRLNSRRAHRSPQDMPPAGSSGRLPKAVPSTFREVPRREAAPP